MIKKVKYLLRKKFKKDSFSKTISFENGYIFVHIPKNAGTSMLKALDIKQGSHRSLKQYKIELDDRDYRNLFKFCFVRNPYSRFLSLYNYARMDESYHHSAIRPNEAKDGKHYDYDKLKSASLEDCARLLVEGKLEHNPNVNLWQPQYTWITNKNDEIEADFIGRFENLEKDFKKILRILEIDRILLNHLNMSKKINDYRTEYTPLCKELVESFYKKDLELFDYEF